MSIDDQINRKVFISYVSDNTTQINDICKAFAKNDIEYWLDRKDIDPGKFWKDAIKNAINEGAYFLACFSAEYKQRTETYMNAELIEAVEILTTKHYDSGWFIPIKLSECEIPPMPLGAGRTLNDIHYLPFWEDWDTNLDRLIEMIRHEEDSATLTTNSDEIFEKQYIYQGLKSLIERGDGTGFHNADLGHPVYVVGAKELDDSGWTYADSPEKNTLFKMLSVLSKELKEVGTEKYIWWYDFSEWKDFCKFALDIYNKKKGYK